MTQDRWSALMNAWGIDANEETFDALTSAYAQAHRHYHTARHIQACLTHFDTCRSQLTHPDEVELALWFHDAIYNPLSGKNERKSADWAGSFLQANGASQEKIARVDRLIMVTRHDAETTTLDESLLVDIDLAILGADERRYADFEAAVRQEYRMIPAFVYKKNRAALLRGFLARSCIYRDAKFRAQWEERARANLRDAIARLGGRP